MPLYLRSLELLRSATLSSIGIFAQLRDDVVKPSFPERLAMHIGILGSRLLLEWRLVRTVMASVDTVDT